MELFFFFNVPFQQCDCGICLPLVGERHFKSSLLQTIMVEKLWMPFFNSTYTVSALFLDHDCCNRVTCLTAVPVKKTVRCTRNCSPMNSIFFSFFFPPSSLPPTHHAQLDQLWNGLDLQRGQLTWSMLVGVDRSWSGHFAPRYCTGMCLILQHLQNCCSLLLSLHFLQVSEHLKQTGRLPLLRGKPAAADLYVRSCSDKNRIARLKF